MSTRRSEIRKPQVDGWAELALANRREPGARCGSCPACTHGLPGDICSTDPRWAVEPKSDGRLYRRTSWGGWEVVEK